MKQKNTILAKYSHLKFFFLVFLCLSSVISAIKAQENKDFQKAVSLSNEQISWVDSCLNAFKQQYKVPGLAFAITYQNKVIFSQYAGYASLEDSVKVSASTVFRIASMSKSFTAMAILKLVEQGKLQLHDKVIKYVPELKAADSTNVATITIEHLLSHTSGLPEDNAWGDRQLAVSSKEFSAFLQKGLYFSTTPGVSYEYSNVGFTILGLIIERITQKSYGTFIKEQIWQPLNMKNAFWNYKLIPKKELAKGYSYQGGKWITEPLLADGIYGAMGGMLVSLPSFLPYLNMHNNQVAVRGTVSNYHLKAMQKPTIISSINDNYSYLSGKKTTMISGYGYGLRWQKNKQGVEFIGHSGGLPGFGCNWTVVPQQQIGIVLFTNKTYAPASAFNLMILSELLPQWHKTDTATSILQQYMNLLMSDWQKMEHSNLYANNFFLDEPKKERLQKIATVINQIGNIVEVGNIAAENKLRGTFKLKGNKGTAAVFFSLTPENKPTIQSLEVSLLTK
ncbi:MAG: serine hydrolase domain-containing protein [Chitinophagaceae bacterium]